MHNWDLTVSGIDYVIERITDPTWHLTEATHPAHIFAYALAGRSHYQINGQPHLIRPGSLIFMPRGTTRSTYSDPAEPWSFLSIAFDLQGTDDDVQALKELPVVFTDLPLDLGALFRQAYAAWSGRDPGHRLLIRGIVSTVLHHMIYEHSLPEIRHPHTKKIREITAMLRDNYATTFGVDELADRCNLSPSHFRMVFKEVTGMTATAYQQHVRITKAIELLSSGECNVSEASRRTGFRDVYYFSRLFKKVTGAPPSGLTRR